jgi:predicted HicB family RNase H-like nuclease
MMIHKGYVGMAHVDLEAGVIRGKVVNTRDTITFQGKTVEEAHAAFRDSVDDYLEFCASLGEAPEKPFSGKFLVRLNPEDHRNLTLMAVARGLSFNKFVGRVLKRAIRRHHRAPVAKDAKVKRRPTPGTGADRWI